MIRNSKKHLIKPVIALIVLSGMLFSACDSAADTSSSVSSEEISSETSVSSEMTTAVTTASEMTTTQETTSEQTSETTEESTETEETETDIAIETSEGEDIDIGYGSYGFMKDGIRFHSQNDISRLLAPEDSTIYDYGARNIHCSWIDTFYYEDSFDMTAFDSSDRFLSFYNEDTSVTFSGYTELGEWTTPRGSNLELYIAQITIISDNLEIRILPHYLRKPEEFNVSVNGRGYYVSEEQLQMVDFILSSLYEEPGVDPLEGIIIGGKNHTYYF